MTALKLIVTAAGRAALSNAARDGTGPTKIDRVGITATSFAPLPTTLVIPGEIKRIATISGGAVAADTLHVTIRDDSTDTYSVRGIGLYLTDGTLFAAYSQATDLLSKSIQATMLLAGDVQFADIDATELTFGDTNFQMSLATTDVTGVVRLATDPEAITGTNGQLAITPKGLLAALNARLGAAAPSAFVKTLLDKVSALAFVTALGIRGAASYDIGHSNGLDADTLDGQHGAYYRSYGNLTGVPDSFPPAPHRTDWSTIDNVPTFAQRWATWAEVTGKPVTFTPSPHSHAINDINGLPAALDGLSASIATKAPLNAPTFTGGAMAVGTGDPKKQFTIAVDDFVSFNYANGYNAGRMEWKFAGVARMTLSKDGLLDAAAMSVGGKSVWHPGNFIPANKLDNLNPKVLPGGNAKSIDFVAADGSTTRFYIAHDDNSLVIATANDDGTYRNSRLNIPRDSSAPVLVDGAKVWNASNFDPSTKQNALGYTPVQQSTGVGQLGNLIKIGWSGTQLKATVDATDMGAFAFTDGPTFTGTVSLATLAASGAITGASIRSTGTIMAAGGFQVG